MDHILTATSGRNKEFTDVSVNYSVRAFLASVKINMFPSILRPYVTTFSEPFLVLTSVIKDCGTPLFAIQFVYEASWQIPHPYRGRST